ncbi:34800_t:CDS:1, partial [Gigaspora margarita]
MIKQILTASEVKALNKEEIKLMEIAKSIRIFEYNLKKLKLIQVRAAVARKSLEKKK